MLWKKLLGAGGLVGGAATTGWSFVASGNDNDNDPSVSTSGWGLQEHDIICICYVSDTSAVSASPTMTGVFLNATTTAEEYFAWYKVTASPPSTVSVDSGASDSAALLVQAFRHSDGTAIAVDVSATATGASGMPDAPSVTTTQDDALVVAFGALDVDRVFTPTAPSGYTNVEAKTDSGAGSAMMASKAVVVPATEDPAAFGGAGNDVWAAATVAFYVA